MNGAWRSVAIAMAAGVSAATLLAIQWRARAAGEGRQDAGDRSTSQLTPPVRPSEAFSAEVALPVVGSPVLRDTFVMTVSAAGQAEAARAVTVASEIAGIVRAVLVREGDAVRAGQVLARIESRELSGGAAPP